MFILENKTFRRVDIKFLTCHGNFNLSPEVSGNIAELLTALLRNDFRRYFETRKTRTELYEASHGNYTEERNMSTK